MSHDPGPLLAAALIVRDEAQNLPGCLESLAGVVDEIHVHDTGSADGTPEIAARLGALVTRGPWTDDFAATRNAAQHGRRARWVLTIDADERYRGDPAELRALLTGCPTDLIRVEFDNEHDEIPYTHVAGRLHRPSVLHWRGRVHEQLVAADGTTPAATLAPRTAITLEHRGYAETATRTAKAVRNAALARRTLEELAAAGPAADRALVATTLLDLGRSLVGAGRRQEALNTFETLRELAPGTPEWLHGTDFLARLVLAAGMDEVCLVLVEQMREAGASPPYCAWLAAQALAQLGDAEAAAGLLAGVTEVVDTTGRRHDPRALHELKDLVSRLRQPA